MPRIQRSHNNPTSSAPYPLPTESSEGGTTAPKALVRTPRSGSEEAVERHPARTTFERVDAAGVAWNEAWFLPVSRSAGTEVHFSKLRVVLDRSGPEPESKGELEGQGRESVPTLGMG